jgi:hypothetical protein
MVGTEREIFELLQLLDQVNDGRIVDMHYLIPQIFARIMLKGLSTPTSTALHIHILYILYILYFISILL